ncbi:MAG: RING finger domain-containing protein [Promethearchaeia archaeon]
MQCGHIFCEECVYEWLQREQTCPLCRATVRSSHRGLTADGSTSILPIIF